MKNNAGVQFLTGCFVIFAAYKFWSMGIFDAWLYPDQSEGIETSIAGLALNAAIAAVQWVGYAAILLACGLQPMAESIVDAIKQKLPTKKASSNEIDAEKLNSVLMQITERLDDLEANQSND